MEHEGVTNLHERVAEFKARMPSLRLQRTEQGFFRWEIHHISKIDQLSRQQAPSSCLKLVGELLTAGYKI